MNYLIPQNIIKTKDPCKIKKFTKIHVFGRLKTDKKILTRYEILFRCII